MNKPPSTNDPGKKTLRVERHIGGKIKTNRTQSLPGDERRHAKMMMFVLTCGVDVEEIVAVLTSWHKILLHQYHEGCQKKGTGSLAKSKKDCKGNIVRMLNLHPSRNAFEIQLSVDKRYRAWLPLEVLDTIE